MEIRKLFFRLTQSAISATLLCAPVYAAKIPHALATDLRIKQIAYDPNQVFELAGTYGYQTSIEFAQDEQIKVVTLGDSIAWQTVPYQNRLFLKPVESNAATNLTVVTNKRTYYFKLNSTKDKSTMTFLLRFIYSDSAKSQYAKQASVGQQTAQIKSLSPANLNLDYGISGNKRAIRLAHIFDDGQFTYFAFDKNTEIPSFYTVTDEGSEALVNTRREGKYMVVERIAERFTLRNGRIFLCVKNNHLADEKNILKTTANQEMQP